MKRLSSVWFFLLLVTACSNDIYNAGYQAANALTGTVAGNGTLSNSGQTGSTGTNGSSGSSGAGTNSGNSLPPPPSGSVPAIEGLPVTTTLQMSPPSGAIGTTVSLRSSLINGVVSAKIGSVSIPFYQVYPNIVEVEIPVGAVTGIIQLTSPQGVQSTPTAFTVTQAPSACGSGAFPYSGKCFYQAALGQGCSSFCTSHNGYSSATRKVIGSAGTQAACGAVAFAFGYTIFAGQPNPNSEDDDSANGSGCAAKPSNGTYVHDAVLPTQAYTTNYIWRRLCACNQ